MHSPWFLATLCLVVVVYADSTTILLKDTSITVDGDGVTVDDTVATITKKGTYTVTGTLDNGQLVVDSDDDGTVEVILDTADITSESSAAFYVKQSDLTVITISDGTVNYLTDAAVRDDDDESNACLFSKDPITFQGAGKLIVQANYEDGITT